MDKKKILEILEKARKRALKLHTRNHHVDYRISKWNDPVDGLDYAIGVLKGEIKVKNGVKE